MGRRYANMGRLPRYFNLHDCGGASGAGGKPYRHRDDFLPGLLLGGIRRHGNVASAGNAAEAR